MATFNFCDELPYPEGDQFDFDGSPIVFLVDGVQTEAPAQEPAGAANADKVLTELEKDCSTPFVRLADLPDPKPEADNPAALFRNGWLRKGGGAFLVAPSGVGKSTWTIQAAICWRLGKAAFGIKPVRPLRVAIIQAEDDAEEMSFFRNQIAEGLQVECGMTHEETAEALKGIALFDFVGSAGDDFVGLLGQTMREHPEIDLWIINPFQSYFGGDISRNSEVTRFLRVGIDPLIKPANAAVVFAHHTNKAPPPKERVGWGTDAFSQYIGAGGAELANWARAILVLMPTGVPGVFTLAAGKRGGRLGWVDPAGAKTNTRLIAHSGDRIFWRDATPEEAEAVNGECAGKRPKYDTAKDAERLADELRKKAENLTDARKIATQLSSKTRGAKAFDAVKDNPAAYHLSTRTAKKKGCMFIGTAPDVEAAVRAYDAAASGKTENEAVLPA
jgi:hypothetical protein